MKDEALSGQLKNRKLKRNSFKYIVILNSVWTDGHVKGQFQIKNKQTNTFLNVER